MIIFNVISDWGLLKRIAEMNKSPYAHVSLSFEQAHTYDWPNQCCKRMREYFDFVFCFVAFARAHWHRTFMCDESVVISGRVYNWTFIVIYTFECRGIDIFHVHALECGFVDAVLCWFSGIETGPLALRIGTIDKKYGEGTNGFNLAQYLLHARALTPWHASDHRIHGIIRAPRRA